MKRMKWSCSVKSSRRGWILLALAAFLVISFGLNSVWAAPKQPKHKKPILTKSGRKAAIKNAAQAILQAAPTAADRPPALPPCPCPWRRLPSDRPNKGPPLFRTLSELCQQPFHSARCGR